MQLLCFKVKLSNLSFGCAYITDADEFGLENIFRKSDLWSASVLVLIEHGW